MSATLNAVGLSKDWYVGDEAQLKRGVLMIRHPVEFGVVTNWDDMEKIWHHSFYNELRVAPEEHRVLISEVPLNPPANREKATQIMFETFNVPQLLIASQAVLSLHASGRETGVVLESGDGITHVVPVLNGQAQQQSTIRLELSGRQIDDYLGKLLWQRGYSFTTPAAQREIVPGIKEKLAYVALDFEQEMQTAATSNALDGRFELSGDSIVIGSERFRCTEAMFKPSLIDLTCQSVHEAILSSVANSSKSDFLGNVVLGGGNTLFSGFDRRLQSELSELAPDFQVNIVAPPERKNSVWLGGSMISATPVAAQNHISKEYYDEHGPAIAHRKHL